jgi:hypothetical protein
MVHCIGTPVMAYGSWGASPLYENEDLKGGSVPTVTPIEQGSFRAIQFYNAENGTPKTSDRPDVAKSFSQQRTRPPAPAGLLEQRFFERLRLHWLAQRRALSAPPQSAKPRSHSERREVKALLVMPYLLVVAVDGTGTPGSKSLV